jgi:cytochrome c biogenesis protein CcmG, thiol:disulfide interchange protein DsbE
MFMKTIILMLVLSIVPVWLSAQLNVPSINLSNTEGKSVSFDKILNSNQPVVMVFYKSYDSKCCENLENMQSAWLNQLKENGVKLIGICADSKGTWSSAKSIINGRAWEFDNYFDTNGDLKRALGVTNAPYTLLFNQNHEIICRYEGYCTGNEDMVCEKIKNSLEETENAITFRGYTGK